VSTLKHYMKESSLWHYMKVSSLWHYMKLSSLWLYKKVSSLPVETVWDRWAPDGSTRVTCERRRQPPRDSRSSRHTLRRTHGGWGARRAPGTRAWGGRTRCLDHSRPKVGSTDYRLSWGYRRPPYHLVLCICVCVNIIR